MELLQHSVEVEHVFAVVIAEVGRDAAGYADARAVLWSAKPNLLYWDSEW